MADASDSYALRACLFGAVAGFALALNDFGAQWLWLDTAVQRAAFLLGLTGTESGAGAILSLAVAVLWRQIWKICPSAWPEMRRNAAATFICAFPAFVSLSNTLFAGAAASKLPHRNLLIGLGALAQTCGFTAYAICLLNQRQHGRRAVRFTHSGGLLFASLGTSKIDQWVYPGHYVGLHLALTLLSAFLAAAAAALFLNHQQQPPKLHTRWLAPVAIVIVISIGLGSAQSHQNVRVAMTHPRASHARSLAFALAPLLSGLDAVHTRHSLTAAQHARRRSPEDKSTRTHAPTLADAHILLITVDALRADHLGAYGYDRSTSPFIDSLADSGIRYERAYAQTPHSSHSLASLFTSSFIHIRTTLKQPIGENTLARSLAAAGYRTAAFFTSGIFHTDRHALEDLAQRRFDFDRYEDDLVEASEITRATLRETNRIVALGEPNTFLWAHYFDVHAPYQDARFGASPLDRYDGEIAHVDAAIRKLVTRVRRRFSRPVIVLLTADHGEAFREHGDLFHGSSLYEEQIHVPLILNAPALAPAVRKAPVQLVDIATTLLPLIGLQPAAGMRGRDLLSDKPPKQALSSVNDLVALNTAMWKLIIDLRFSQTQLFNVAQDPQEAHNLVDKHPLVARSLQSELDKQLDRAMLDPSKRPTTAEIEKTFARAAVGDARSVPNLLSIATNPTYSQVRRINSINYLAKLGAASTIPKLSTLLTDSGAISSAAAVACGKLGSTSVLPKLKTLLEPNMSTRVANWLSSTPQPSQFDIALAIARLGDTSAVKTLLAELKQLRGSGHEDVERTIIAALGSLRDRRAFSALARRVLDPWLGYAAVRALDSLNDPRAIQPLLNALKHGPTQDIRNHAAEALGNLGNQTALAPLRASSPNYVDHDLVVTSIAKLLGGQRVPINDNAVTGLEFDLNFSQTPLPPEKHPHPAEQQQEPAQLDQKQP